MKVVESLLKKPYGEKLIIEKTYVTESAVTSDITIPNFYCHSPPSADSRRVVVSYKRKYVHEVLVNRLVKLVQEKVWLSELAVST